MDAFDHGVGFEEEGTGRAGQRGEQRNRHPHRQSRRVRRKRRSETGDEVELVHLTVRRDYWRRR